MYVHVGLKAIRSLGSSGLLIFLCTYMYMYVQVCLYIVHVDTTASLAGNRVIIRLGDKEVDYNPDFKFYITTKLSNPHYTPEISTKTTIVNFAVKEQGLEAQLLGIVVRKERPELEESKDKLVVNIASSKKKLADLEDEILRFVPS